MLKKILIGLAAVVVILLVIVGVQPATYHVERSITVKASAEVVFGEVDDFKSWNAWSPWDKLDPGMQKTYEGPESGVGAIYTWSGNDDVGSGKMTITGATAPQSIAISLEFIEPFASVATTTFSFKAGGAGETVVTWGMDGDNNFMGKAFSLVMDMDSMIGSDFDRGLATLKQIAESKSATAQN